jgi:hypothetical protein
MVKAIGIDPGTVSFDICGLDGGQVFLDTTLPSPDFAKNPQALIDLLQSTPPADLIAAPSGYGLPLVPIEKFGDEERFLFTLVDERERDRIPVLGGMGKMISLMKASGLPILFIPGVIHLPTVPEHRKANRVDMGTTDKLCCLALGIFDQARHHEIPYSDTSFIYVEVGGAYTSVMAVQAGKVIDGIGGTIGSTAFIRRSFSAVGPPSSPAGLSFPRIPLQNLYITTPRAPSPGKPSLKASARASPPKRLFSPSRGKSSFPAVCAVLPEFAPSCPNGSRASARSAAWKASPR